MAVNNLIAVACSAPECQSAAEQLAAELQLPYVDLATAAVPMLLVKTPERLELRQTHPGSPGPIYVDFLQGKQAYRQHHGGGRRELIARAVGLQTKQRPYQIIDATAGFGRDAFVLANLGCQVVMLEQSSIIAALLADGLQRFNAVRQLALQLIVTSANDYLAALPADDYPDVIYLDPMFPEKRKSALVKKEMQLLQQLALKDQDEAALLAAALSCARQRVVVKRPNTAPPLGQQSPSFTLTEKHYRMDVYTTRDKLTTSSLQMG